MMNKYYPFNASAPPTISLRSLVIEAACFIVSQFQLISQLHIRCLCIAVIRAPCSEANESLIPLYNCVFNDFGIKVKQSLLWMVQKYNLQLKLLNLIWCQGKNLLRLNNLSCGILN
jgi:hypothetical protein